MTIISTSTKVRILGQEMTLEERSSEISEWAEMLRQSSKRTCSQIRSVKDSPYAIDHSELITLREAIRWNSDRTKRIERIAKEMMCGVIPSDDDARFLAEFEQVWLDSLEKEIYHPEISLEELDWIYGDNVISF